MKKEMKNRMKLPSHSLTGIVLAAWMLIPFAASSQDQHLTIKPGVYVREPAQCKGAPNASILSWDGTGFSGPHSSKCTSTVLRKNGKKYEISTSCSALGDGSPNPSGTPFVESFALTWLSSARFTIAKDNQPAGTYRWCSGKAQD
jgi:hypothetical protein